jgi:two-component system sensor histidine kinase HydH
MVRVLAPGPELAERPSEMIASARMKPTEDAWSCGEGLSARSARRWPRREDLYPLSYYLAVAATLAAVAYPTWRIGVLAAAAAAQQAGVRACRRRDVRQCVNADVDTIAWFVVLGQATFFVTTWLTAAVTGGLRSPMLVTFVGSYFAAIAVVGDRRPTRLLLGATALGAGALGLLPSEWSGPELAAPVRGLLTALGFLGVGALLAPVNAETRRKREQVIRARSEMAADALARVRSLEQIGSKVAHELKNPLTGVKALVQLGLRNPAEAPSHERLEVLEREATRMQDILQNYLSFTRPLEAAQPRRVELGALVSDTLVILSARADDARVRLYAEGDATLEADPRRLKEALLNLVTNAIEATPPGGEVIVEVRRTEDGAEIVVRDTGRGMPAETLTRIGTPFFTTRDDGTGLGVVLARSVIAQHGGSLRYESEPGKGTRVSVTLPRVSKGNGDAARAAGG